MSLFVSRSLLRNRLAYLPARRFLSTQATSSSNFLRTSAYTTVLTLSAGVLAVYYFDARSALHRYVLTPVLRNLFDPETGHKIAVKILRTGLSPKDPMADDPRLKLEVRRHSLLGISNPHFFQLWGEDLYNPIGIAAGFDKDGEAIDGTANFTRREHP